MLKQLTFVLMILASPLQAAVPQTRTQIRHPVALVATSDLLYAANHRTGTISVLDPVQKKVLSELPIGKSLSDLKILPNQNTFLALDEQQHQLIQLNRNGNTLTIRQRQPIAHSPVTLCLSETKQFCSVASLWARRITFLKLPEKSHSEPLPLLKVIDLPFAPRAQHLIENDTRLIVADSHRGRLAVIDTGKLELLSVISFDGHNVRGMATSHAGDELLIPHQLLNENATTSRDLIFWGGLMSNMLRSVAFKDLESTPDQPTERRLAHWSFYPFGIPSSATGDPAEILITAKGQAVVSLSGVNEIAVRSKPTQPFVRRKVGTRPTAVTTDPQEQFAYVANTFDDTISQVQLSDLKVVSTIPLGPRPKLTPYDKGEILFYNAKSSLDGWYSCHSCHTDGHTTGLLNDNLSDGSFGSPKRILTLLGASKTGPWAWNGSREHLPTQIEASMKSTMQGKLASQENIQALHAYMQRLTPPPSLAKARNTQNPAAIARGKKIFKEQGCIQCHRPPLYTTPATYDVGLEDKKEFNPPSLLGVSQRTPYFHDNRAESLKAVFAKYKHGESGDLSAEELPDLLEFLRSL